MNRTLLRSSLVVAASALTGWLAFDFTFSVVEPAYIARTDKHSAQGIDGAFEYYKTIRANVYSGEIEMEDIYGMRDAMRKITARNSKNNDVNWVSMGPDNVGGRVRAILPFPNDPNTVLAGGVSGGIFKTTDAGQNWVRMPGFSENLAVSSIQMLGNGAIYVGTGNSREGIGGQGGSGFVGGGLFVSNDEGNTWSLVSNFTPQLWNLNSNWITIDAMVSDPINPDRLWIGTDFGLYPYIHGSATLNPLPTGLLAQGVRDVVISTDGTHILTMIGTRLFVSTDSGLTFTQMTDSNNNFPSTGNAATELAISKNNKNFMYASVSTPSGFLRGIWATTNAGQSWNVIAPNSGGGTSQFDPFFNGLTAQGNYDNMLTVIPDLPDGLQQVIVGGIRMWRWTLNTPVPGITAWEEVNANFASFPGGPPNPFYVHSDIHTDAWDNLNRLYVGCDGGIFRSENNGFTWSNLNRNFRTTQYYAVAFDPNGRVLGGLQDNGTLLTTLQGSTPEQAVQFSGGDGFDCEISQLYPQFMFSTIYNGEVFRSSNGGNTVTGAGNLFQVSSGGGNDFFTDIALHEHPNNDSSKVFVNYTPDPDSPFIQYFGTGIYELSNNGDTIIGRIPAGTQVVTDANTSPSVVVKVLEEDLNFYSYYQRPGLGGSTIIINFVGDTVQIQERAQFTLAAALSNGVFITRQPIISNASPSWFRIGAAESNWPSSIEWSPDGNHLYVGYSAGTVIRYSGFNSAWLPAQYTLANNNPNYVLTKTTIHSGPGAVTDIEVDYSLGQGDNGVPASQRVVITHGGYGGSAKVRVSNTAATAPGSGTFMNIWNVESTLLGMPVYSVVMDVNNTNVIMAGTEYGIWYTGDNGQTWTEANNGEMNRVPIFDLRQQKRAPWNASNSGVVYAGSHGRGIFRTDYLQPLITNTNEVADVIPALAGLKVFPNPMADQGAVQFDLGASSDVTIRIFSITGQLVKTLSTQRVEPGRERMLRFDTSELPSGVYILQLTAGDNVKAGKFVKTSR